MWYNTTMNKVITKTVMYRGKEVSVNQLKPQSSIKVIVECKHGQREVRWCRRHRLCKKCSAEAGVFNTCKKGRKITWGDKISKAKKGVNFTKEHKKALLEARVMKVCNKKGISREKFEGFPTKGEQFKIRNYIMNKLNKSMLKVSVEEQDNISYEKLGYKPDELKEHLENLFEEGMTWDNYGKWHIDHKIPDSWFSYSSTDDVEFKECWALSNLQPMWAWQNIDKNNKYEGNYRPRKLYMLGGQFGSGKTTMCKELIDKFTILSYDDINIKNLDSFISNNYYNDKPILLDIPTNISTVYGRYVNKKYDVSLIMLIESPDVIKTRLLSRNGKINSNFIEKRYKRMLSLRDNYSMFSGDYDEVLMFLHNLKI